MFDFFKGKVASLDSAGQLSLEVNGVGYLLKVSEQTRKTIPLDDSTVTMFVRLVVKEDDMRLFGFSDIAERAAFDLLTSVNGVGPATAIEALSMYDAAFLKSILISKDVKAVGKIKGIGKKTAEKIIIELNDKAARIPAEHIELPESSKDTDKNFSNEVDNAYRALVALGFVPNIVSKILTEIDDSNQSSESLVRLALLELR